MHLITNCPRIFPRKMLVLAFTLALTTGLLRLLFLWNSSFSNITIISRRLDSAYDICASGPCQQIQISHSPKAFTTSMLLHFTLFSTYLRVFDLNQHISYRRLGWRRKPSGPANSQMRSPPIRTGSGSS